VLLVLEKSVLGAVVANLDSIRIGSAGEDDMMAGANIVRS